MGLFTKPNGQSKYAIFKLKSTSLKLAIAAFALFLLLNALSGFDIIKIPEMGDVILSFTASLIILFEVGLVRVFGGSEGGKKGMDLFNAIGVISAILIIAITTLGLMDISFGLLESARGIIFAVMFISFLIEAFVR